jgi:pimeloyl-ACP methyl ester carboxylesterase
VRTAIRLSLREPVPASVAGRSAWRLDAEDHRVRDHRRRPGRPRLPLTVQPLDVAWENPAYARFLKSLASVARVIVIDRRGTGVSDRDSPADLSPLEDLVDDLSAVLDAVGSEPAALFGFSDAGALCAMFAANAPGTDLRSDPLCHGRRPYSGSRLPVAVVGAGVGGVPRRSAGGLGHPAIRGRGARIVRAKPRWR